MKIRHAEYRFWPSLLSLPLGILAAVMARYAVLLPFIYEQYVADHPLLKPPFIGAGMPGVVQTLSWVSGAVAAYAVAASLLALFRRHWTLKVLRVAYLATWLVFCVYYYAVFRATGLILAGNIAIDGVLPVPATMFFWRYDLLFPAACAVLLMAALYWCSWCGTVISLYTGRPLDGPAPGDRWIENLRTHGSDPAYRKSLWSSVGIHLGVIVIIPWLLTFWGCVDPYRVPKGSGTPTVAGAPKVVLKAKVVKKKKKRFILNPQSAISFHIPDLDESDVGKTVEEMSRVTYTADPMRVMSAGKGGSGGKFGSGSGKMGAGGGKQGGWPDGMENGKIRFIRLEYGGQQWDDGMDAVSRADINFLEFFQKLTGFTTAPRGESHSIGLLAKYPKGMAPPFVYMTGAGEIRVSDREVAVLRDYLMGGGMLFADCGSPRWDPNFRSLARRIFPGEDLKVIADDDMIFQLPFTFANGAPPLWHHGGMRALGVKYKGRWAIFYHPGDLNDAWKTGHSGMSEQLSEGAMEMGVNIVYYAFTHYLELTRKDRK